MTKVTADQYKQYQELQNKLADALDNRDENAITQINAQLTAWAQQNSVDLTQPLEVEADTPDNGYVKPGGWGASTDANTWTITNMKDTPTLFKIVDSAGKNVAVNFRSQAGAQAYIDAHKGTTPPPPPPPSGDKDQFGIRKIFPDKAGGQVNTNGSARYFTRHYASGKPDDPTVEYTVTMPSGHQQDLECTCIVEMTGMNHNDTVDWKTRGPAHQDGSGKAWYCIDQETNGGNSGTKFQVERPHPSMHDNSSKVSVTGYSPPNLSSAKFGWKGITVNMSDNDVYIACWINMTPDDESGWRKIWDVHDKGQITDGQITPPTGGNVQIRIDGIKGKPLFTKGSVREITYSQASADSK